MPTAGDAFLGPGGLPISHSPLDRIGYFPNRPEMPDLNDLIDAVQEWLGSFLFPAIKRYTGIDLAPLLPIINNVIDNLQLLFGFLDQETSTFDKVAAGAYLIENVLQYTGLLATIESLGKLMTGIDNATGGQISQFFNDIRYIIGDPLGLGTGTIIIGSSPFDIPLLAPITQLVQDVIDAIVNALGYPGSGYNPANILAYLTSVVGDLAGLVSGVAAFVSAVGGGDMAGAGTALNGVATELGDLVANLSTFLSNTGQATWAALGILINSLIDLLTTVPAELISGTLTGAVEIGGRAIDVLVQNLNAAGQFDAAELVGEIGDAVTVGGTGIASVVTDVFDRIQEILDAIANALGRIGTGYLASDIQAFLASIPAPNIVVSGANTLPGYLTNMVSTGLYNASAGFGNLSTSLLKNLTPSGGNIGQFDASALTGALNGTITLAGTQIGTLLQNLNSTGQFAASQLTGALNGAVTLGGTTLSTLVTNINSSGQLLASGITGALGTSLTVGGVTLSTLFTNINSSGQLLLSGATGALNTAVTVGGTQIGTLLQYLNSSGQFNAAQLTGAINTAATIGGTALSTLTTNWNAAVTDVNSLISGVGGTVIADVNTYLQNVPNTAVQGLTGFGTNIGNSITALSDGVWQGLRAFLGIPSGVGPPQVSSAAQQVRVDLNNATDIASQAALFQANQSISKQSYLSIDPSADPVFPLAQINGASPTTVSVTQAKSVMGIIGLPDNGLKKSIVWLGGSLTNITAVYVNLYKVNTATGVFTRTHASANIISALTSPGSGVAWQFYNLPMTDFFPTLQGEWYVAEIAVIGTGTYNVVGVSNSWMPSHPSVYPKALGAARGPAAPTFKSAATGLNLFNQAGGTKTWTHNIESDADFIVLVVNAQGTTAVTVTNVKVGGVAVTAGPGVNFVTGSPNSSWLLIYYLQLPPTGNNKTVQLDISGGSVNIIANSFTYSGVSSVGESGTTSGKFFGTLSHSVPTAANQTVLHAFGNIASLSAYNAANVRWNTADGARVGDFPGTGSNVNVSATNSGSYGQWGSAYLRLNGVVPAAPSSISSPTYDAAVPWLSLAGAAGRAQHPPETVEFETAGTFTYTIPSWVEDGDYIDIVPIGAGAGGDYYGALSSPIIAGTTDPAYQYGGLAGSWNPVRLRYGDDYDIPTGTTTFSVTVGTPGAAAIANHATHTPQHGGAGGNTTVTISGYPIITAAGGAVPATSGISGKSPGNVVFQGVQYFGGSGGTSLNSGPGAATSPGAGGARGVSVHNQYQSSDFDSTPGAPGACYITAVQDS